MRTTSRSRHSRHSLIILATIGAVTLTTAVQAQVRSHAVALGGEPAPGAPTGLFYDGFTDAPATDGAGQMSFLAHLSGSGVNGANDIAIYAGTDDALRLVAREGDLAHGTTGGIYYSMLRTPRINNTGSVAYHAAFIGSGSFSDDTALYAGPADSPHLLVREGPAPGMEGFGIGGFDALVLNDRGTIAFGATLVSSEGMRSKAIYTGTADSLQLVARAGQAAPGTEDGTGYIHLSAPKVNDAGHVLYFATLSGGADSNEAVYAGPATSPQIIAREGSQAPGTPAGTTYGTFTSLNASERVTINDAGQVAFLTSLAVGGVNDTTDRAIYVGDVTGTPRLVARTGDQAPGAPSGVNYGGPRAPALNDVGQIAFEAFLVGDGVNETNNGGLFTGGVDSPQLVVRKGTRAPGTPAGINYGTIQQDIALNDLGQVAYFALVAGEGVDTTNDLALFIYDPVLGDLLVAREGTPFEIGNGEFRTIENAGIDFIAGRSDDDPTGLSSDGRLLFALQFTDGSSGIFEAVIPEPASAAILVLGLPALLCRRRNQGHRPSP